MFCARSFSSYSRWVGYPRRRTLLGVALCANKAFNMVGIKTDLE